VRRNLERVVAQILGAVEIERSGRLHREQRRPF
jgi:hypothetical protein